MKIRGQTIIIKRGQIVVGIEDLGDQTGLSRQQTRTALTKLKSTNEITIKTTTKYSLITINKYNDYQQITNNLTNDQPTNNQQITTTKEIKKERIKEYSNYNDITKEVILEISNKYFVLEKIVIDKLEAIKLWEEEKPGRMKGRNWKATLMNCIIS